MLGHPSQAPVAPSLVPCSWFHAAEPCFAGRSHTLLSRAALARLHATGFPEILDRNQEPVEISEPVDPASFSLQLEEADPLQGNEIILQFLALGRWDGSSSWCLCRSPLGRGSPAQGSPRTESFPRAPPPISLPEWKKSLQRCCFLQHLPWRQSPRGVYSDALVLSGCSYIRFQYFFCVH